MAFSIFISIIIVILQMSFLKAELKQKTLFIMYGSISLILVVVGFLYQELIVILPIAFIYFILWKYMKLDDCKLNSYLMCVLLLLLVVYCHFFNGAISMKDSDYFKVYRAANYHHELFPIKIASYKDKYIIKSIELGIRWKEKAFQETVWFDRDQLIYSHDNCGFGEMCPVEFKYGTKRPHNYP